MPSLASSCVGPSRAVTRRRPSPRSTGTTAERYLSAFESGTLTEAQCGKRLEGLAAKVRDLRQRRAPHSMRSSTPQAKDAYA